jgi:Restriction endonuclease NaeI
MYSNATRLATETQELGAKRSDWAAISNRNKVSTSRLPKPMDDQLALYSANLKSVPSGQSDDPGLERVKKALKKKTELQEVVSVAIRDSIDNVIDGRRTMRWSVHQLEKTEKTHLGTHVEIELKRRLNLPKGGDLDSVIEGEDVDIKFSIHEDWMIPTEAVGKLCIVASADDDKSEFSIGIVRANESDLRKGKNKDQKKSLSANGKLKIHWLVRKGKLEENFLLHLDPKIREEVTGQKASGIADKQKGQQRVNSILRRVKNKPIPRQVFVVLGQQHDPMKRVRDAKKTLLKEGIAVVCGRYKIQQKFAQDHGFALGCDEVMSFDMPKTTGKS